MAAEDDGFDMPEEPDADELARIASDFQDEQPTSSSVKRKREEKDIAETERTQRTRIGAEAKARANAASEDADMVIVTDVTPTDSIHAGQVSAVYREFPDYKMTIVKNWERLPLNNPIANEALDCALSNRDPMLVLGGPKSQKTMLALKMWHQLSLKQKGIVLLSPSLSACHFLKLETVESFMGMGRLENVGDSHYVQMAVNNRGICDRLRKVSTIIIDDFQMMPCYVMNIIGAVLTKLQGGSSLFGSTRLILLADYTTRVKIMQIQRPNPANSKETTVEHKYPWHFHAYSSLFGGRSCFHLGLGPFMKMPIMKNMLYSGYADSRVKEFVHEQYKQASQALGKGMIKGAIHICKTTGQKHVYNLEQIKKHPHDGGTRVVEGESEFASVKTTQEQANPLMYEGQCIVPARQDCVFFKSMPVFVIASSPDDIYSAGMYGIVHDISPEGNPIVWFAREAISAKPIEVKRYTWTFSNNHGKWTHTQYPIIPAYCITIDQLAYLKIDAEMNLFVDCSLFRGSPSDLSYILSHVPDPGHVFLLNFQVGMDFVIDQVALEKDREIAILYDTAKRKRTI